MMGQQRAATENFYTYLEQASNPQQILRYTEVFERRDELEPTIAGYTRMLELWGDDERAISPLNNLGNVYLRQRDPEKAIHFYRKAVELQPNILPCTYNLGYALEC
jgi:tetratricopeptide (TPR) repeat protein